MSKILELLKDYRTISIIGMAKNVGKTTVLNYILSKARGKYTLGLTSIGRDGEEYDQVAFFPKPRIYIAKGSYIATAKEALLNSDITKEIVATTGFDTPMGEIVIAKALSDGYVDLAGPSINSEMAKVCNLLLKLGCDKAIIDGALSRKTQASPSVSEATILATGAALSYDMEETIRKTAFTVKLLSIEAEKDKEILKLAQNILDNSRLGFIYKDKRYKTIELPTAIDSSKEIVENLERATHVVIKGVVSDKLIEDVMRGTDKYKGVVFLAEDSTKLFLQEETFLKFQKGGGILKVLKPVNLVCVTINPVSSLNYQYDKKEFLERLKREISIPVFDVMGGD
ncbi:hypothetical protein [Thermoanaerobacter wiegelii]|uniref:Uncharacterized protein n=1 Tax=Thermoanaerobacter wiegelii Rt8.B1 TaxID=697303 RepID=G2MWB3_9THEO|nr:hypothetical protein [Thermoanaerobacter wiegelii]AEM78283.1 hypothetical protein Thewi_0853 [Thermoanaerobacter wiegelii Rt8.B1]